MKPCGACAAREATTTVKDHGMGGVDITLGLRDLGGGSWECPDCGQRYRRKDEISQAPFLFADYDLYFFAKEPALG